MKRAAKILGGSALGGAVLGVVLYLAVAWAAEAIERAEAWA